MNKIVVPITSKKFYEEKDKQDIKNKIDIISNKYGKIIEEVSKLEYLPANIIKSFIFIESGGDENATNGEAVGLMQISPLTVVEVLYYEYKYKRMSKEEEDYLIKYIGRDKYNDIKSKAKLRMKSSYLTSDLIKKPELNILFGTMYLSQLFDRFTENEIVQIHKIVTAYNAGLFSKTLFKVNNIDINEIENKINKINKTTANYILKLAGTNGLLTFIV